MASDVAFTFDDGPYTYTSDLLDKLKVYNAKATFFISKLESFQAFASLANNGKLETTSEKVQMHCNFLFVNAHYFLGPIDSTPQWNALIKVYHLREAFSYKILMKVQRMVAEGHQIASHTWSHQNLTSLDATHFNQQMIYNEMAFNNILGYFPTYMRYVSSYESIINFYADM